MVCRMLRDLYADALRRLREHGSLLDPSALRQLLPQSLREDGIE
jgi:hypothetical protein